MTDTAQPISEMNGAITRGGFTAQQIADDLSWGVGTIQPQLNNVTSTRQLILAVLDNLTTVSVHELPYSACTDGRRPVQLLSSEPVPVREQLVGADIVSAFYVAEVLGARFYDNPTVEVVGRLAQVAQFLQQNGLQPSSHVGCGAAGGFAAIVENTVRFGQSPAYRARLRELLPAGVFDAHLHEQIVAGNQVRLAAKAYDSLNGDAFVQAAQQAAGSHAIAELKDDGRGVHGHVEEAIVRLQVPGVALNTATLAQQAAGRQVFGVNDLRMDRLAQLFARSNDGDYRLARLALEDFASSGHATLAKNLPTYVVRTIAS